MGKSCTQLHSTLKYNTTVTTYLDIPSCFWHSSIHLACLYSVTLDSGFVSVFGDRKALYFPGGENKVFRPKNHMQFFSGWWWWRSTCSTNSVRELIHLTVTFLAYQVCSRCLCMFTFDTHIHRSTKVFSTWFQSCMGLLFFFLFFFTDNVPQRTQWCLLACPNAK